MEHTGHQLHHGQHPDGQHLRHGGDGESLNRIAIAATLHCLAGCAVGEIMGLVIGSALGWSNVATIILAITLAFISGFAFTTIPFLRRGFGFRASVRIALAADTASITVMEVIDNTLMMLIPGAMDAPVTSLHFWASMMFSLAVAGVIAFPLNRWLIGRGKGHALAHVHH